MLNMSKRSLYSLAAYFVVGTVVQAQQPDGYLGCFQDSYGNSLTRTVVGYSNNNNNTGERCITSCKNKAKRLAGAKKFNCYCGDGVRNNIRSATCTTQCPGNENNNELCGNTATIAIYDTLITSTTKLSKPFSTSSPVPRLSTTSVSTTQLTTDATSARKTTSIKISTTTSVISVINATVTANNSMFSDNPTAQTSTTPLAVYVSVPLTVVFAAVAVIIFLIIRKKRNQKKDDTSVIYKKSDKDRHTFSAVANKAYSKQDIIQSDIPVYVNRPARNMANSKNVGTNEESNFYNETTDDCQRSVSNNQIPFDEYGYGHLKSMTTAVSDPTYSHTQNFQSDYNRDCTYSHAEKTTCKPKSDETIKADNDTYSNMDKSAGKHKARISTDDTYSKLNIPGTKVNQLDKQTEFILNEPEYDHTDFEKPS